MGVHALLCHEQALSTVCNCSQGERGHPWTWAKDHGKELKSLLAALSTSQSPRLCCTFPSPTSSMYMACVLVASAEETVSQKAV